MELVVFLALIVGLDWAARNFGADSRDGYDWADPDLATRIR